MKKIVYIFSLLLILLVISSCAPMHDAANELSGEFGEVSDELGKPRQLGQDEDGLVVEPGGDKKVRMKF